MEQGSLRVDANLSIRRPGETRLGTKTEVKNMNSFANVERALEAERARQIALLESGQRVQQVTLLFNAGTGQVKPTRSKEESHDYRYFPDPDLPPLELTADWIAARRDALPGAARGSADPAGERARPSGVRRAGDHQRGRPGGLLREGGRRGRRAEDRRQLGDERRDDQLQRDRQLSRSRPARLAGLVALVRDAVVSHQAAKRVYQELAQTSDGDPKAVAERLGLVQVSDQGALAGWVEEVLAAHPAEVGRYRSGETKLMAFFVGQVMKKSKGKADPKGVQPVLVEKLK